jgi:hypothetical protein
VTGEELLNAPRVGLWPVVQEIKARLREKRGFSLIRLGDGEGAVLAYDDPAMAADLDFCLAVWFGDQVVGAEERAQIAAYLGDAIRGADVVGLPRRRQLGISPRYGAVFDPAARILAGPARPLLGDTALHFYLQWSGALGDIMLAAERITLIGCRDLAAHIAAQTAAKTRQWLVRGEHNFAGAVQERHWRDGYDRIMSNMAELAAGELVLVGAGVLGKSYCLAARAQGAVAIDIGSVMDGWAGVNSRPGRITNGGESAPFFSAGNVDGQNAEGLRKGLHEWIKKTNIDDGTY